MGTTLTILGIVIGGGIVLCGLTYYIVFRAMPWDMHDSDLSFAQEYEKHAARRTHQRTHDLTFKSFLELYQINPKKWHFFSKAINQYGNSHGDYCLFYEPKDGADCTQIVFSKKDYLKFRRWMDKQIINRELAKATQTNSSIDKNSAQACQWILEDVQKDIDAIREEAQKKIDEAREITEQIAANSKEPKLQLYRDATNHIYLKRGNEYVLITQNQAEEFMKSQQQKEEFGLGTILD